MKKGLIRLRSAILVYLTHRIKSGEKTHCLQLVGAGIVPVTSRNTGA